MSSLDIAPYPEGAPAFGRDRCRIRRRLRVSFRRAGSCTFWRLGFRQFSFHRIARVSRRAVPDTWTRPPVSCHALFPLTFRRQVRHQTQENPSNPSRLSRGYDEAPRGAPRICRIEYVTYRILIRCLTELYRPGPHNHQGLRSHTGKSTRLMSHLAWQALPIEPRAAKLGWVSMKGSRVIFPCAGPPLSKKSLP